LVELTGIWSGATILDMGCGRGAILFPAATQAGPTGKVVGIDIAGAMVQHTAEEIERLGLANVEVYQMDAEALQFPPGSFDFVFCGFALYKFFDLNQALAEALRVLKPQGVFGASIWGKKNDTRWDAIRNVFGAYRDQFKPVPQGGPPARWTPAEIEAVLSKAGFLNAQAVTEEEEFWFQDEEDWFLNDLSHGNRELWERMEPPIQERCKQEVFTALGQLKQARGIPILFQMVLARADKP
jgi:SAM-dependent methyltransferase